MDADRLTEIQRANGAHLPASDRLISELADVVRDLRQHERSGQARPGDLYSGNLHGWMGERMAQVLTRLITSESELAETRIKLEIAERQARERDERVANLEATLERYVGSEPTVAEEMAYLNRCLNTVLEVCAAAERQATRWELPLPVPEWVAAVRHAASGGVMVEDFDERAVPR